MEIIRQFLSSHDSENVHIYSIDSGLINNTFKVRCPESDYILQKINTDIFPKPSGIQNNIISVGNHLKREGYPKGILSIVPDKRGQLLYFDNSGSAWRLLEFISDTAHYEVIPSVDHAFEAAKALGEFHSYLSSFESTTLSTPIEGFLDFLGRKKYYETALHAASNERRTSAFEEITFIKKHVFILDEYLRIIPSLRNRVIHGDPKISNFLFKENSSEVRALIDWDTIMQGTILYDFGDMVRSSANRKDESDATPGQNFDEAIFKAIIEGYLIYQKDNLEAVERDNLTLGAKAVIYVQALRFLTDYLNGDVYYKTSYSNQNLDRSKNQIQLLKGLLKSITL